MQFNVSSVRGITRRGISFTRLARLRWTVGREKENKSKYASCFRALLGPNFSFFLKIFLDVEGGEHCPDQSPAKGNRPPQLWIVSNPKWPWTDDKLTTYATFLFTVKIKTVVTVAIANAPNAQNRVKRCSICRK